MKQEKTQQDFYEIKIPAESFPLIKIEISPDCYFAIVEKDGLKKVEFSAHNAINIKIDKSNSSADIKVDIPEVQDKDELEIVDKYDDGSCLVRKDLLYGVMNGSEMIIEPIYKSIIPYKDFYYVFKDGKYGCLGLSGEHLTGEDFEEINFVCNLAIGGERNHGNLYKKQYHVWRRSDWKKIGSFSYFDVSGFYGGKDAGEIYFIGNSYDTFSLFDSNGRLIVSDFDGAAPYEDDKILLCKDNECWFTDLDGKSNCSERFDDIVRQSSSKHYKVSKGSLYGLLDEAGYLVVPCEYQEVIDYVGPYSLVRSDSELYAIYDHENKTCSDFAYTRNAGSQKISALRKSRKKR